MRTFCICSCQEEKMIQDLVILFQVEMRNTGTGHGKLKGSDNSFPIPAKDLIFYLRYLYQRNYLSKPARTGAAGPTTDPHGLRGTD